VRKLVRLVTTPGVVVALAIATFFLVLPRPGEAQLPISKQYKYTGTGSCASSSCHGAAKPAAKPGDPDNTYRIWAEKDKHNQGYNTLTKKSSVAIAQRMKLGDATKSDKCLGCHALNLGKEQLAPRAKYDVTEGVSCDSCHGPAEKWLDGHDKGDKGGWPHAKSVSLGMYDTKDVLMRANLCVSCHLAIDPEMIAAGHPTMIFELDSFSKNQPPHWKDVKEWFSARAWGTGQAVALREAMQEVASRTKVNAPDKLVRESWEQARGHAVAIRPLLERVAADSLRGLDQELGAASEAVGKDRAKLQAAAAGAARIADDAAKKISQAAFNRDLVQAILKAQVGSPERAVSGGLRSAEQVAMAVDSLYGAIAAVAKGPEHKAVNDAINKLFDELAQKPEEFNARTFTANLQGVAKHIK
jgi:hypothetical protein